MADSTTSQNTEVSVPRELTRARGLAYLLDDLLPIPGTRFRIGLDPILGLLPGLGDWISWVISGHLLWCAWRLEVSAVTLARMASYLLIDAVFGAVPALGTLFDIGWRANDRILQMLERHVAEPDRLRTESRVMATVVLLTAGGLALGAGWIAWSVFRGVLGFFGL